MATCSSSGSVGLMLPSSDGRQLRGLYWERNLCSGIEASFTSQALSFSHSRLHVEIEAVVTLSEVCESEVPNEVSRDRIYHLLLECTRNKDLAGGRLAYSLMTSTGIDSVSNLGDHLIRLFASCGSLKEANEVFWNLAKPSVHSWQAIISAHAINGESHRALELYKKMEQEGMKPNKFIFPGILKACSKIRDIDRGKLIHDQVKKCGLESDIFIGNTLVDMYAKCGNLEEAHKVFNGLPTRDVVSWNAMISGYAQHGHGLLALEFFAKMQVEDIIKPTRVTFLSALKACCTVGTVEQGKVIHNQIIRSGLDSDVAIGNALVDMYAKCGSLEEARKTFHELKVKDVVSWNTMIAAFVQHGNGLAALSLLENMKKKGIDPDEVTFSCILKACGSLEAIGQGELVHENVVRRGLESNVVVGNTLVDMYAKCGNLEEAHKVFDDLQDRDIVSWGAMIAGYVQHGHGIVALELFEKMKHDNIYPNKVIALCIVQACGMVGAIEQGKCIHDQLIRTGLDSDVVVGSTLVEFYAKCGCLEESCKVFDELPDRDVVAWGTMIAAYAQHGNYRLAGLCLEDMQEQGLTPDAMIYTSVLAACSQAGQAEEGQRHFKRMRQSHITPGIEHLNCMVDLLGRVGELYGAEELLETMPFVPVLTGWMSLLTSCRIYGDFQLGRRCFDQIVRLDPNYSASYVLMSNIYADACMLDNALQIQELRKFASAWRKPGRAWIEVKRKVHEFVVGDRTHPQSAMIYAKLNELRSVMKQEGYAPDLCLVLDSISDKDKEDSLFGHCEKLAIGFGLLTTAKGATIRVAKNLRVCADCHNASKIISKIESRQIIISDAYRVHFFEDGACSCGDHY